MGGKVPEISCRQRNTFADPVEHRIRNSHVHISRNTVSVNKKNYCHGYRVIGTHGVNLCATKISRKIMLSVELAHFLIYNVLSKKSIREAVYRVKNGAFPKGINAIVFLLYKPVGLASQDYVIGYDDPDYLELLRLVTSIDCNWKYGFDTCQSPAIYKFAPGVAIESIEFCEAARFSMYINSRCIAFPCSFGIGDDTFSVNLKQHSLQEAWESESFAKFREKQTKVCANCTTGICRSCGLELGLNLCGNIKGNLQ